MKKRKVAVLMGGMGSEHEVSLLSGLEVAKHLSREKYEVFPVIIAKEGIAISDLSVKLKKADVVFLALHGPFGEDGRIQGYLDLMGIPYTGSGVLASALGMDKIMFLKIMEREKIRVPSYRIFKKDEKWQPLLPKLKFPQVVKPHNQGSSVGVSLVKNKKDLKTALAKAFLYSPKVLIQQYVKGTEVSCGVLGHKTPKALPVIEILPKKDFFDYEAKYTLGKSEEIVPARIPDRLAKKIQSTAIKIFKIIGCQGFARVDMIVAGHKLYVLEINTIPGLTSVSLLPKEAKAAGLSYPKLLDQIIELALS